MVRFMPVCMPHMSRTVVNPMLRWSRAALAARAPISSQKAFSSPSTPAPAIMLKCTCESIRPGISVRPPPSIRVACAPAPAAAFLPIALIRLSSTSTLGLTTELVGQAVENANVLEQGLARWHVLSDEARRQGQNEGDQRHPYSSSLHDFLLRLLWVSIGYGFSFAARRKRYASCRL